MTQTRQDLPLCCCLHPEAAHGPEGCSFCAGSRKANPCKKLQPISHTGTHSAHRSDKPRRINASRVGAGDMVLVTFDDLYLTPVETKTGALVATVKAREVYRGPVGPVHLIDTDLGSIALSGEEKVTIIKRKKL